MITLAIIAFALACGAGLFFFARKSGKQSVENEVMKETLDDVHTAKLARDRLAGDNSMRRKLRGKYTRK